MRCWVRLPVPRLSNNINTTTMLGINDLKKGTIFIIQDDPYEILEADHLKMGRGSAVLQVKIRNLRTKNVLRQTFHPSDSFKEAEVTKEKVKFVYSHRGEHIFSEADNPSNRFSLPDEVVGDKIRFLKPNTEIYAVKFDDEVINIVLPVKVDLKVKDAPPSIRGDTAQGGKKIVSLETGAEVAAPLFIEAGDIIRVNTETGEYAERVSKGS